MRLFSSVVTSAAAFAFVTGLSLTSAHALSPVGKPFASSTVLFVADKPKKSVNAPGRCGTGKYYDKKTKKCADAALKKT